MTATPDPPVPDDWLLARLARAERLAGTAVEARLADLAISYAQFRLIGHLLDEPGGLSQKALALRMGLDPSSISVTLGALERRGLIRRSRDGGDRRRVTVRPALDAGSLSSALERAGAVESALAAALGPEDMACLAALLDRAAAALVTLQPPGNGEKS